MADRNSLRIPRSRYAPSRNSSARSSALYEDYRQPTASHALRAVDSRFSLNEHFAASRQEYEFGDDDASSIFDRATLASDAGDGLGDLTVAGDGKGKEEDLELDGDCYDILCLPRAAGLTSDQIRRAYYRMFLLFYPENYPESLRPVAERCFARIQEAFETLIDPYRRADYNTRCIVEDDGSVDHNAGPSEYLLQYNQRGASTYSDLGIRFGADRETRGRRKISGGKGVRLRPLDFTLGHSVAVSLPAWKRGTEHNFRRTAKAVPLATDEETPNVEMPCSTLVVSGAVYGVVEEMSQMPITLLSDRYQPLMPAMGPGYEIVRLAERKMSPLVSVKIRQDFLNSSQRLDPTRVHWTKSSVEVATDVLPAPSVTTRLYHHITLPNTKQFTVLDASIGLSRLSQSALPRLTLGVQHRLRYGTAFVRADSGDWAVRSGQTCRFFTEFSKMSRTMSYVELPLTIAPSLEVGVTTERPSLSCHNDTLRHSKGIKRLDEELGKGSWTISASSTFGSVAGFMRYSKALPLLAFRSNPTRLEAEACSNIFRDRHLALRSLWSLGSLSSLGLEVGISTHSIHLSICWSRCNQRITIPLLLSQHALLPTRLLSWASAVCITSFAVASLLRGRNTPIDPSTIARQRQHADTLTALLAPSIDTLQKHRATQGGIVILSAKFGVQDDNGSWAGEEVADVTVAVAALVPAEGGGLVIPAGARKGRLPGFWDPAPGTDKVLHVRYTWRGKEAVVEVRGREELALPSNGNES